jgi:hypothetical protein
MRVPVIRSISSLVGAALVVVVLALYAHHVATKFGSFTVDDAAISYAYAHNLAHGDGFRLTANASPVEGFSNPLQVLLLVPFAWIGANLDKASKFLNLAAVVAAVLAMALIAWRRLGPWGRLCIAVPCAFGFLWPAFNHWIVAGLEGGLFCGLQILSIALLATSPARQRRDTALGIVALLLALTRPEGVIYGGLVVAFRAIQPGRRWRPAAILCLGFACLLLVRYALFRQWVANTYYAKINVDTRIDIGIGYVRQFWQANGVAYFLCLLPFFALVVRTTRIAAAAALAQGIFVNCFAVLSGGDWMRHWRFMQFMQGPFWALCLLGLMALFSMRAGGIRLVRLMSGPRAILLGFAILPLAMTGWADRVSRLKVCSEEHDVDMRRIANVADQYHRLGDRLDLGRPLLIGDVDVGGMSYPPGIDVLDMGGLADNVFGYSWTRRPTEIVDYLFQERRPDTIHIHGGWFGARPVHSFSPFPIDYRVMGPTFMDQLGVVWLTAIRSDLVDTPAAPVLCAQASLGSIQVLGFSAVATGENLQVLFVHALQTSPGTPPAVKVKDASQHDWQVQWHTGHDVERGPVGSVLLGKLELPTSALPVQIESTDIRLTNWPSVEGVPASVAALTRLPLFRSAGLPSAPCDVDAYLDPRAHASARARGVALLAQLCGGGFSRGERERVRGLIVDKASTLASSDDRYDAYRVSPALGLPTSTSQRVRIERERARHTYLDEVALAWAASELGPSPLSLDRARASLGALFLARQYDRLLLTALSRGLAERPEVRDLLCDTVAALGLRPSLMPTLSCSDNSNSPLRVLRQGFENASDPSLHFDKISRTWLVSRPPTPSFGGQGRSFLFIPPCRTSACGEVTWGPLPWPGRRFGVLLAGPAKGASVVIEAQDAKRWVEIGRTIAPVNATILTPQIFSLPVRAYDEVRVRIANRSQQEAMMVDALTFLDLGF